MKFYAEGETENPTPVQDPVDAQNEADGELVDDELEEDEEDELVDDESDEDLRTVKIVATISLDHGVVLDALKDMIFGDLIGPTEDIREILSFEVDEVK